MRERVTIAPGLPARPRVRDGYLPLYTYLEHRYASSVVLTLNGGANEDVLIGSDGADTFNCDTGTDYADGGPGIDSAVGCETTVNIP